MNVLNPKPEILTEASQTWPDLDRTLRLVRRMAAAYAAGVVILAAGLSMGAPWPAELRATGLGGIAVATLLLPLAGLCATWPVVAARRGLGRRPDAIRRPRRLWARQSNEALLSWVARRPQGVIVPVLGAAVLVAVWAWWPREMPGVHARLLGGAAIVLGFPLLVAERVMAGVPQSRLPEAPQLQALLLVPVLLIPLAGLAQMADGWWVRSVMGGIAAYPAIVAAELTVRALANWFLPQPAPGEARASVSSLVVLLLQPGRMAPDGLAKPLRTHFGIDFARSWTLRCMRAATVPMLMLLGLLGWALTGVSLIGLDRRGVYERFGAPVAVWAPGLHVGLPWPLGRVQLVELGVVHSVPLGGAADIEARPGSEDVAPTSADRLWDRVHPTEISTLIASQDAASRQGFQVVSVDLRVLYRAGLDDVSALRAAYRAVAPESLVRAETGRLLTQLLAGASLSGVLAEDRATLAGALEGRLQAALDRLAAGLDVVGVTIEAIHPPLGAAEAFHNVQAAEIVANTAIATERGRALATAAMARQNATELVDAAQGGAAEAVGAAEVILRGFAADHAAAEGGKTVFLMERYFANVASALARSPLVIVDHRLAGVDAPVIDLRPFGAPGGRPADDD